MTLTVSLALAPAAKMACFARDVNWRHPHLRITARRCRAIRAISAIALGLPLGRDGTLVDGLVSLLLLETSHVPGSAWMRKASAGRNHGHRHQHRQGGDRARMIGN
jgi:hypothetical protein